MKRSCELSVSEAENRAERAEAELPAGVAENDGAGAERGAGSGLNRPLTASSNLTFR